MAESGIELVRQAIEVARKHGFRQVEFALDELRFDAVLTKQKRSPAAREVISEPIPVAIKSPMVGYLKDKEGNLAVGKKVERGQILAIVEALGLSNDIECEETGEIVEVFVKAGEPVDFGKVLATVKVT